jgi:hypothetical protein
MPHDVIGVNPEAHPQPRRLELGHRLCLEEFPAWNLPANALPVSEVDVGKLVKHKKTRLVPGV